MSYKTSYLKVNNKMTIIRSEKRSFDINISVAIIGGGACGMTAALSLKENGAECIIFEQDKVPFGSTGMSYGAICAAGSQIQKSAGIEDCADDLYEDILTITNSKTDSNLARLIADLSGPTVDWLHQYHDINLTTEKIWTGLGHRQPRLHAPPNRSGETLMSMLNSACSRSNIDILTQARVVNLFADETGYVHGLRVERSDGAIEEIGTQAVILATSGFGANAEWVGENMPEIATATYYGHEGNRGDGIGWGIELGGETADMSSYQALGSLAVPQMLVIPHTLLISGGLQVNNNGERFQNELFDISGQSLNILKQPEAICWIVYDEKAHKDALRFEEYLSAVNLGVPKQAETTFALAEQMKIPFENFTKTIQASLNYVAGKGSDPFGRDFTEGRRLDAPFYAIRVTGALFHTQGGLCIDHNAAVVRPDKSPLPNLFAGGGAARSVSGPSCQAYLPGMGLCTAVSLGRLAGKSAALHV